MRGIVITSYLTASFGFSSTFSLPTFTLPANWSATASMVDASRRHGPHHGAQKSATTSVPLVTCSFQFASVSSITFGLAMRESSYDVKAPASRGRVVSHSTQKIVPLQRPVLTATGGR